MANLEFSDTDWAAVSDGIFIPTSDLPGSIDAEFASGESTAAKQGQFLYSFLKTLQKKLSGTSYLTTQDSSNFLGVTATRTETIPTVGLKNNTFTFINQWVGNKTSLQFTVIPLATTGSFLDGGKLTFNDASLFPNAAKIAAAGQTGEGGVLIPSSELANFGITSHSSIDLTADSRMLIQAILNWLKDKELLIRTASVASSVTAVGRSTANITLPALAFDETNPTTGLGGSSNINQNSYMASSETISFTIQNSEALDETSSVVVTTT